MSKEEVALVERYTKWKVFQRKGKKVIESVKESVRMTPSQALKHFKASAIIAVLD